MPTLMNHVGFERWGTDLNAYQTLGSECCCFGCKMRICLISPDCHGEIINENVNFSFNQVECI